MNKYVFCTFEHLPWFLFKLTFLFINSSTVNENIMRKAAVFVTGQSAHHLSHIEVQKCTVEKLVIPGMV